MRHTHDWRPLVPPPPKQDIDGRIYHLLLEPLRDYDICDCGMMSWWTSFGNRRLVRDDFALERINQYAARTCS